VFFASMDGVDQHLAVVASAGVEWVVSCEVLRPAAHPRTTLLACTHPSQTSHALVAVQGSCAYSWWWWVVGIDRAVRHEASGWLGAGASAAHHTRAGSPHRLTTDTPHRTPHLTSRRVAFPICALVGVERSCGSGWRRGWVLGWSLRVRRLVGAQKRRAFAETVRERQKVGAQRPLG
jgi:hypothetical protein